MPPKRNIDDPTTGTPPTKQVKIEHRPEEFSNTVKKRLQSSTRTGQACDRCKVRKIRCDGLAGGCSPCLQNNTECRTTDRITGRATSRGYVENLETQNRDLQNRVRELEQQLAQSGIEVRPASNSYHDSTSYALPPRNGSAVYNTMAPVSSNSNSAGSSEYGGQETNMFKTLPAFRAYSMGDNYLGVSSGNSHLSSIKGTALSILGMEIDIADFSSTDMDEPDPINFHSSLYNKSYQAFLQSYFNVNPRLEKPDLPPRHDGLQYAVWYFRVINPYCPILHKGAFFKLLTRMYDDPTFRPTTAENVTVHIVFAIMFFQSAMRNWEDAASQANLNNQSNMHYHYSLGQFYQLACSHTLADVQAMTLICAHLRSFPKPGASWMLTQITLSMAIELGLHRSVKRWHPNDLAPSPLDTEVRKRVFWAILCFHVTLSGKLGRPIAIRPGDFDVEYPEPMNDDILTPDGGIDTSKPSRCIHSVGIHAWKLQPLFMDTYSMIYAVRRRPENHVQTVTAMEARLRHWQDTIPPHILKPSDADLQEQQELRVFSLYMQQFYLELKLLLRHPSVSMTNDPVYNAESMRICVESSRHLLSVVRQMQKHKSLDTTWYNTALYVMAITTTLFAQWEKRNETSAADLAALREEMDIWLNIMKDLGGLLGSGERLPAAVRVVSDGTLGELGRQLANKNTGYTTQNGTNAQEEPRVKVEERRPLPPAPVKQEKKQPAPPPRTDSYAPQQHYNSSSYASDSSAAPPTSSTTYLPGPDTTQINPHGHQQTPYPAATQYSSYPDHAHTSHSLSYSPPDQHPTTQNAPTGYTAYTPTSNDAVEAPLLAAFAAQASQVAPHTNAWASRQSNSGVAHTGSQAWQQWTSTMAGSLEPQDCYSAGAALMQLNGSGHGSAQGGGMTGQGMTSQEQGMSWPLNIFDMPQGGGA